MWKIPAQPSLTVYSSRGGYVCLQQEEEAALGNRFSVISVHPDALAGVIERMQAAAAQVRGPDVAGIKPRLPRDLKAALHPTRPRRVKVPAADEVYGTGTLVLKPLRALKVEFLKARPQVRPLSEQDPHRHEDGYYAVPAVRLVQGAAADALVWLPDARRYGTFDREHTTVMVFRPGLTWTKLRADIARYFAATNAGGGVEDPALAEYFCPWPAAPFVATAH
ncbi:MAG TPA: hypothetical protein VH092_24525 [Urbifossiella sp.]|jgi:hypothetical protein|nr:hypothetical protein [Urbifossiella sp.]